MAYSRFIKNGTFYRRYQDFMEITRQFFQPGKRTTSCSKNNYLSTTLNSTISYRLDKFIYTNEGMSSKIEKRGQQKSSLNTSQTPYYICLAQGDWGIRRK